MANEEVLGPRKTMFVLVIVVGCFAVLWPRILSPLVLGPSREQLKPNKFDREAAIKQERPLIRGAGPHPALRERGRAIPPGVPSSPTKNTVAMPPHVRPPPIPGMRPPLGSPGGPVPTPKSSMGFVMPIYTICIIVFFVYTLSKILFKRTGSSPYEPITPDPQFRRRVFRDDSRTSPDKLGPKERDTRDVELEALRARLAETERAMQRIVSQLAQRDADVQDNNARPYTNGTILHNSGPVHIVASEYRELSKESLETVKEKDPSPEPEEPEAVLEQTTENKEPSPEPEKESTPEPKEKEATPEPEQPVEEAKDLTPKEPEPAKESSPVNEPVEEEKESTQEKYTQPKEPTPEPKETTPEKEEPKAKEEPQDEEEELEEEEVEEEIEIEESPEREQSKEPEVETTDELIKLASDVKIERNGDVKHTEDFLKEEAKALVDQKQEKQSTPELLEEAIKDEDEQENASVKVVGMEVTAHAADGGAWRARRPTETPPPVPQPQAAPHRAHEAEQVQSIFLETEIPQQSRVLVADFAENRPARPAPTKHSPMVVSGKMTLSLIQDAPRDTPERDPESTVDDFTTASAITQNAEKEDESDEEVDEEIEVEEIEEEVEEEEEDEPVQPPQKDKKTE